MRVIKHVPCLDATLLLVIISVVNILWTFLAKGSPKVMDTSTNSHNLLQNGNRVSTAPGEKFVVRSKQDARDECLLLSAFKKRNLLLRLSKIPEKRKRVDFAESSKINHLGSLSISPPHSPTLCPFHPCNNFAKQTRIFQPPGNLSDSWRAKLETAHAEYFTDSTALDKDHLPVKEREYEEKEINSHQRSILQPHDVDDSTILNTEENFEQENTRLSEEVACRVFGLLSLQGPKERRYDVTVEELHRRVDAPELLNKVDLISYVRLAKNSARDLLQKHDVIKTLHNRHSKRTVLSKVSEEECKELADGIRDMNTTYFPFNNIAYKKMLKLTNQGKSQQNKIDIFMKRLEEIQIVRSCLRDFLGTVIESKTDEEIKKFELISHTFGVRNLSNQITFISKYFETEEKLISENLMEL